MNDKLDHFVLEYDGESGIALLAMTEGDGSRIADGAGLPYALARGYDADARTWEKPEEVRLFLRTDADVYLFGSSLGKSLTVEDRAGDDIAPALREVRTYCKDATEKRDPQIIGAMAQAAAAKSATAEGDAGGKKL